MQVGLATCGVETMQGLSGGWPLPYAHDGGERERKKGDEHGRCDKCWREQS